MSAKSKNQTTLTKWVLRTLKFKAKYDLSKIYRIQTKQMIEEYVEDCSYAVTVILRTSGASEVSRAQEKLHSSFNEYCKYVLGPQCMDNGKLTSRNRKYHPLVFLAFDIEGTRINAFDVAAAHPHGHGVITFDTHTVFNFRCANARFLCSDGSYHIVNPTPEIALIKLAPFCSIGGVERFVHYSLKYAVKLSDNQHNFRTWDFYPPTSVNYPFWRYLTLEEMDEHGVEAAGQGGQDALEQRWDLVDEYCCVSPSIRRGEGGAEAWRPAI